MTQPEMVMMDPRDLTPYDNNPRDNDDAVPYLMNSIHEFGFQGAIIINRDNVIVAGHTRQKALLALLEEGDCGKWGSPPPGTSSEGYQGYAPLIPCFIAETMTSDQIDQFRIVDNAVSEKSYWDRDKLEAEQLRFPEFRWADFAVEPLPSLGPMAELPVWGGTETPAELPVASSAPAGAFNGETKFLVIVPVDGDPAMVREMLESEGCTVKELE